MKLFDLSLQFNGYQIKEAKQTLTKIQSVDDSTFEAYVNEQKWQILNFHLQNNSFYKALANKNSFSNWNAVPILTKRDLQVKLENRLSKGYSTKSVYVNKTSGSSGDPFVFAKDRWCHAMTWAVIMDRFSWYNIDFNTSKQARFYGIPLDNYGYFKERFKDWLSHRYRFSIFDLSDNAFEKCLQKFNKTAFQYINGYTSAIVQFAKYLKRQNIVLNNVCPSLTYCFVTSEMLFDDDKALMASVFGVPVINEYGAL